MFKAHLAEQAGVGERGENACISRMDEPVHINNAGGFVSEVTCSLKADKAST